MGGDMAFVAAPMYITEIANQNIRGFFKYNLHYDVDRSFNNIFSRTISTALCPPVIGTVLLLIELITFSSMPETLFNNKYEEAKKSLPPGSINTELNDITKAKMDSGISL
ncbi:hypothetical protein NQ317_015380 [Molorchus minor]|uniref:Uncharacterized protein n=1 Tax=Molorchus minor TaxID=1323400 RepID=A0ABQ9J3Y2_9CUCU|nr:hypothetical protein NQ317_015380 [Molorchus minor]